MPPLPDCEVDADHRFVVAPDILGVDRQVRHLEQRLVTLLLRLESLLDRVLMRTRERCVDEVAGIGVPLVDRQLGAVFGDLSDLVDVVQVELRIDPLA